MAYEFNQFRVELQRRRVLQEGQVIPVTPKVFDTLVLLIERRGEVVTKDEMLASLWPDAVVEENNLGQVISKLRQALGEVPGDNAYIATMPGRGYRFVAETRVVEERLNDQAAAAGVPAADKPMMPSAEVSATAGFAAAGEGKHPLNRGMTRRVVAALLLLALSATLIFLALARRGTVAVDRITSVAVLPFKPLVPENRDQALEFGIADILIRRLATLNDVSVRSLGRVRRYADTSSNPLEAGRELGVDAVLDGHIHRSGERIRITARLVRVSDERQLWSGQFDEDFRGVFDIQDSIARRVAEQLAPELDAGATQRMTRRDTSDPAAYESYLRGRFFMSLAQPLNAIRMFEEAVGRDPTFAVAHAGLADIYSRLPVATDGPSADAMARAKSAAAQAIAIESDLAEAHTALGWIAFYGDWNWVESEKRFMRALQINPDDFSAHVGFAHLHSNTGRFQDALHQIELAMALEPTSPLAGTLRAEFLYHARRYDDAKEQLRQTLTASPGFWIARQYLGLLHHQERNIAEALAEFESSRRSGGAYGPLAMVGYTQAIAGRRAEATTVLRALMDASKQSYVPSYYLALVHLGLGDDSETLDWLERGYAERDVRMVFIGVDPLWDSLRQNRRFVALLESMNFAR
jgi:DNA-binding winged helix-turn-helix (wHTH) protein/TolB-like protein/thioredoxin-like negative regulator of GroEL